MTTMGDAGTISAYDRHGRAYSVGHSDKWCYGKYKMHQLSGKASRDLAIIRTAMCDSKIDSHRLRIIWKYEV